MANAFHSTPRIKPVVVALLEKAEWFCAEGEPEHAAAFFRAAVAADSTGAARIAYGVFLADTERDVAARNQLEEAWESAKRGESWDLCAWACHNLAALHRRIGQAIVANSYQQQALSAWMRFDPMAPLPGFLRAGRAHDLVSRESVCADRLWSGCQCDDVEGATSILNRAVVMHRQGRDSLARQLLREAFQRAEMRSDLAVCSAVLTNLAILERQNGRWSIASECLIVAERIERESFRPRSAQRIRDLQTEMSQGLSMLAADPHWN